MREHPDQPEHGGPDPATDRSPLGAIDDSAARWHAETARLLTQAVERRLPGAGPGAGHLSGGLDSSPIAVLAARALARSGRAFYGYTFREPEDGPGLPGTGDAPVADLVAAAEPGVTQIHIASPGLLAAYAEGVEAEPSRL